ncbi:MAG: 6-phosphofructokinase, partial [Candidatus Eisenbacteria bacterium]|nr:6-phosphofructokinase [Candidatus Eisenbacteria bacterium]
MAEFSQNQRRKTLAILVGGGPAPGINGVIRSVTNEALGAGMRVLGIMEGFRWLAQGDGTRVRELDYDAVSGIHFDGGSVLRTSRTNPASKPETLEATVRALTELGVDYLVTIGGDDTASSAMKIEKAGIKIGIAHVPKTIDNDLPLPGHMPTFGYETARAAGVDITQAMMVDAETTNRWYYLVSMGRKAGHLALGIGKAAGATLTIIGEEFRNERVSLRTICDILESSHIKRMAHGRPYG